MTFCTVIEFNGQATIVMTIDLRIRLRGHEEQGLKDMGLSSSVVTDS